MDIVEQNESQIKLSGTSTADTIGCLWVLGGSILIFLIFYFSPILSVQLSCRRTNSEDIIPTAHCLVKEYWFWGLYKRNEMLVEYVSGSNIEIKEEIVRRGRRRKYCASWSLENHGGLYVGGWGGGDCGAMEAAQDRLSRFLQSNRETWTYTYRNRDWLPSTIIFILTFPLTLTFLGVSYQRFYYPRMSESLKYKETLVIDRSTRKIIWESPKTKFRREYDFPDIEAMIVQKYTEVIQGSHGRSWEQNHFKIYFTLNVPGPPRRVPLYQGRNDATAESLITQIPKFLPVKIEHQQLSHRPEED